MDIPGLGPGWSVLASEDLPHAGAPEPIGGSFGRGGVVRLGDLVIRPYRRGGFLRHLNERTYPSPHRFQNELGVHRALWSAGLPTVPPVGCAWRRLGWGYEGAFLTTWVEGQPWPRQWGGTSWEVVAGFMAALAAWGCWIPDFNATNVHLGADGTARILDFDRGVFGAAGDLEARYRRRMARSLAKLGAPEALRAQAEGGAR
jgi:hypothetical protein